MTGLTLTTSSQGQVSLQGEFNRDTIPHSESLMQLTIDAKRGGKNLTFTLDLSAVSHVDTAGLAWIINFLKDCRQRNLSCSLENPPESLLKLAKISDVERFLSVQ